jgi:amino acid transporter
LSYAELHAYFPGPGGETQALRAAFGSVPAIALPLCARMTFFVCASTLILAAAGYVFNEVFVRWFPNLGFSFCVLGFLLLLNLLGARIAEGAQRLLVLVAWGGLVILAVIGFFHLGKATAVPSAPSPGWSLSLVTMLSLMLFVGFDLAGVAQPHGKVWPSIGFAIGLMVLLFAVWGIVSQRYVPLAKLADTSVPHTVVARTILGQSGRVLMSIVALTGTCSAVNAVLIGNARMLAGMATQSFLPAFLGTTSARLPFLLLALGPAAMMASTSR